MSTSPSWFDQEKFSRLVKKVGPKTNTEQLPSVHGADPENRSHSGEGLASTARISLVSKPPSLLSENRALPALPRRTSPLPNLKPLFAFPQPSAQPPADSLVTHEGAAAGEEAGNETGETVPSALHTENDLNEVWHKMSLLNEELARAIQERDQALNEGQLLREQLSRVEEDQGSAAPVSSDEIERVTKERDDAVAEANTLREQIAKKQEAAKDLRSTTQSGELTLLTEERDRARKEYSAIRTQYEMLKQEQAPKDDVAKIRKDFEQQIDELRQKLTERDREVSGLKANLSAAGGGDEKIKQELTSLREQLTRARDEGSIAQRGLALSQKALHETRDTLREATEGTSLSRHNFDNLKNECAILSQQNTVLQAQNDQLTRDLAATKSKLTSRL